MRAYQQAWLDLQAALMACQAAEQNEALVAHWVLDGSATVADLRAMRERTVAARRERSSARSRYIRVSKGAMTLALEAGKLAARRGGSDRGRR